MYCNEGNCVGKFKNIDKNHTVMYNFIYLLQYFNQLIYGYVFSAKQYTCFDGQCSSSFYGQSMKGSNDSVAKECAKDSKCKAFRYSLKHRIGFFCSETEASFQSPFEDWKLCSFDSS